MKKNIKKNKNKIILLLSLLLFALILVDIHLHTITSYDNFAYDVFVESLRTDTLTSIMKLITAFGSALILTILLILMLIILKNKRIGLTQTVNVISIFAINSLIKVIVQRPRPSGYNIITESNYSFPSGHAMVATAFYGFFIYLIYINVKDKKKRYLYMSLLTLLILSICVSRVYLGVHYLSDTIAGLIFSIAYLVVFITIVSRKELLLNEKTKKAKN